MKQLNNLLQGLGRKGGMVCHVKNIRDLGGIEGEETSGIGFQFAWIRCSQVGGKEDVPVLVEGFRSNVEIGRAHV